MPLSGTVDHSVTALDIINDALRCCGVKDVEETISGAQIDEALRGLNNLVKTLQTSGLHLWKTREITVFYSATRAFSLPGAHAAYDYVQTTASGGSGTSLPVASTAGMAAADIIGIEIGGDLEWTTIASVDSGLGLTLDDAMSSDPEPGAYVFTYTSTVDRPLRLHAGRRIIQGNEAPLRMVSREEYFRLSNKDATGKVVEAYYDPQLSAGALYVWPIMDSPKDVIQFTATVPIQDFDATTNNPDFPQEWYDPLVAMLAARLAIKYQVPSALYQMLKIEAEQANAEVESWDREMASMQIVPRTS